MKDKRDIISDLIYEYRKDLSIRLNNDMEISSTNNIKNTDSDDYDPDQKWIYHHIDGDYTNPETENKIDIWEHLKKKK